MPIAFENGGFETNRGYGMHRHKRILQLVGWGILTCFVFSGCFRNHLYTIDRGEVSGFEKINRGFRGQRVIIELLDGQTIRATDLEVGEGLTTWRDPQTGIADRIATAEIKRIYRQHRNTGKGLGGGLLLGAVIGGVWGYTQGESDCSGEDTFCLEKSGAMVFGAVLLGVPFGLTGTLMGVSTKTTDSYELQ